jgi:hypothetical protein
LSPEVGEVVGGFHDGVVDFLGGRLLASDNGVEFGDGEFFARGEVGVDFGHLVGFVVEALQRAAGDVKAEAAFDPGFADALADGVVGFAAKPIGDLVDFGFGECGEGDLLPHKVGVKIVKSRG